MPFHLHSLDSDALTGNFWGDPTRRDLVVYVPPSLENTEGARLAVLLHGYSGQAAKWMLPDHFRGEGIRRGLGPLLDELFAEEGVSPAVVAMPDGWTRLGGGQWLDSPVNGAFTRYVARDVVGAVEREYGTDSDPASRTVLGHSSGGLGAWEIATTTEEFGSLGFLAGDAWFERTQLPWVTELIAAHPALEDISPHEVPTSAALPMALAASYSPEPEASPFPFALPLDPYTAELRGDVWERWLAKDPVENAADRGVRLRELSRIVLDVGDRDEYAAQLGQRALSRSLQRAGIAHEANEFSGSHSSHTHERIVEVLRSLLAADG